uniref:NACHT domain-containing protein n=1 Tax=uncultured Draconibacterium sp. TaxID=1573823 RepID=UPI0032172EC9
MDLKIELTNLISPLLLLLKAAKDEYKHAYFVGLDDYLWSRAEKYFLTNTFLHRGQKVKFMDIYYPLKIHASGSKEDISPNLEFLSEHRYVSIIGSAGSGKSMIMKYLFLESINNYLRIPIFIELRRFNFEDVTFKEFIFKSILDAKLEPSKSTLNRALKSGVYIFIFDGLDEISLEKKELFFNQLDSFIDLYYKNSFVISSRPRAGAEQMPRFESYYVSDIDDSEFPQFIKKVVAEEERQENLFYVLSAQEDNQYLHYFKNPLLFSMFILTFENHPEIPSRKSVFYQNVFDTLYNKHDGITKNSYLRTRKSKLQKDEFIKLLSFFSAITFIKGEYYFTHDILYNTLEEIRKHNNDFNFDIEDVISDLDVSISVLLEDGLEYTFPHRSLQEYFTALFIKNCISTEDSKQKYIQKIIDISRYKSLDRNKQFWSLLYEIDKRTVLRYLLIPLFEEISKFNAYKEIPYTEILKFIDIGFYYVNKRTKSQKMSDFATKKEIGRIRRIIHKDFDDFFSHTNNDNNTPNMQFNKIRRELKVRQVDSIYWDIIDLRLSRAKKRLFNSLNYSNTIDVIEGQIVTNFIDPIPDNYMISISSILFNDIVEDTLKDCEFDELFAELLEKIKDETKIMKKELKSDKNELDFIFS